MTDNVHKDIARHRLAKAHKNLSAARVPFQQGLYRHAVAEGYYTELTALRSLLAALHLDSHRHEGVITLFHQHLVQKKKFPRIFNKTIPKLKKLREDATYADKVIVTAEEAEEEISEAQEFLRTADEVLARLLSEVK